MQHRRKREAFNCPELKIRLTLFLDELTTADKVDERVEEKSPER